MATRTVNRLLGTGKLTYLQPVLVAFAVILAAILSAHYFVNPFWESMNLHVPGEGTPVDHRAAVDSIFYVRIAEHGYQWSEAEPTSLWFHPLLTWFIQYFPLKVSFEQRLWLISCSAALAALVLCFHLARGLSSALQSSLMLMVVPMLPGGAGMLTGNAEWLCLFFTSLVALSFLRPWPAWVAAFAAGAAILTKPNALYLLPMLIVYLGFGIRRNHRPWIEKSLASLIAILGVWLLWILYVDLQVGEPGAYWSARAVSSVPMYHGPFTLLHRAMSIFIDSSNTGEQLKYLTALAVPLVQIFVTILVPLSDEAHRLAIIGSLLSVLLVTFLIVNPNKVIVYVMTFPGHFAIGMIFLQHTLLERREKHHSQIYHVARRATGIVYVLFCLCLVLFFLLGTPLEWYY